MTKADLSNKGLQAAGAIVVGAWISHKDNGALVKFDISANTLAAEGSKAIAEALKGNQVMTELNLAKTYPLWGGKKHQDMSGIGAIADC